MSRTENIRLLVVDDEARIRELFSAIFENEGMDEEPDRNADQGNNIFTYELSYSLQGKDAVEKVRQSINEKNPYSIVFLDVSLPPGKDGFWAAEKISDIDPEANIVIITGDSSGVATSVFNAEFAPLNRLLQISKPFKAEEIKHLADLLSKSWLDKKKSHSDLKKMGAKLLEREIKELADSLSSDLFDISKNESSDNFLLNYQLKISNLKQSLQQQVQNDGGSSLLFGEVAKPQNNKKDNFQIHLDRAGDSTQKIDSELNKEVLANVLELTEPYLEKLIGSGLKKDQKEYVSIIRKNLSEIAGPTMGAIARDSYKFTNSEMKTLNLIKHGKTSREIADIFKVSRRTVEFHRNSIRKKLNIGGSKVRLRSYLNNLDL